MYHIYVELEFVSRIVVFCSCIFVPIMASINGFDHGFDQWLRSMASIMASINGFDQWLRSWLRSVASIMALINGFDHPMNESG